LNLIQKKVLCSAEKSSVTVEVRPNSSAEPNIRSVTIGHKVVFLESLHPTDANMVKVEIYCENPKIHIIFLRFFQKLWFC
jgi:hypothetical protein